MPRAIKRTSNQARKTGQTARQKNEDTLTKDTGRIIAPKWLSEGACAIFERTKRSLRGMGLLTASDADMLAIYSDAVFQYQHAPTSAEKRSWARVVLSMSGALGISVDARLRMAKKAVPTTDFDGLLDDVTNYLNEKDDENEHE